VKTLDSNKSVKFTAKAATPSTSAPSTSFLGKRLGDRPRKHRLSNKQQYQTFRPQKPRKQGPHGQGWKPFNKNPNYSRKFQNRN
jgi:hypothetical protein